MKPDELVKDKLYVYNGIQAAYVGKSDKGFKFLPDGMPPFVLDATELSVVYRGRMWPA
jgi:hypothetical protein